MQIIAAAAKRSMLAAKLRQASVDAGRPQADGEAAGI
jgi:hypothetical protein